MTTPATPRGLGVITLGKFMGNVAFRMLFPFLPAISRGLGVSLSTMGSALAVRNISTLAAPFIGRAVDRRPYRRVMATSLMAMAFAVLLAGVSSGIVLFTVAVALTQVAKTIFDTASGSWLGLHVPFARRGRVIGLTETSWALAFLVGMPILALIIRLGTWRTAFLLVAAGLVLTSLVVARSVPQGAFVAPEHKTRLRAPSPTLLRAMAASLVFAVGHQLILVTFASWLEQEHNVSVAGLGLAALAVGGAELCSSVAGISLIDRLGKVRSFTCAALITAPAAIVLPLGSSNLVAAVVLLAFVFVGLEYGFISGLALFTELDSSSRGSSISWGIAAFSVGHAIGSVVGPLLFDRWGMTAIGTTMAVLSMGAAGIMFAMVNEPEHDTDRLVQQETQP